MKPYTRISMIALAAGLSVASSAIAQDTPTQPTVGIGTLFERALEAGQRALENAPDENAAPAQEQAAPAPEPQPAPEAAPAAPSVQLVETVWQDWQSFAASVGQQITADAAVTPNRLELSNLVVASPLQGGVLRSEIGTAVFEQTAPGTVRITLAERFPMTFTLPLANGGQVAARFSARQDATEIVAEIGAETTGYAVAIDTVFIEAEELLVGGVRFDAALDVLLGGVEGRYKLTKTGLLPVVAQVSAETFSINSSASIQGEDSGMDVSFEVADLLVSSDMTLAPFLVGQSMTPDLRNALKIMGSLSHGELSFLGNLNDAGEPMQAVASSLSGGTSFTLFGPTVTFGASQRGLSAEISGSGLDVPGNELTVSAEYLQAAASLPTLPGDAPRGFEIEADMRAVVLPELIWAEVDATGTLPRTPLTLQLDARGTLDVPRDILQDNAAFAQAALHSLVLREFLAEAIGTRLRAAANFDFDPTDVTTFDGVPRPQGRAQMELIGGNGLLDRLVSAGVLPAEQASSLRLMAAAFTTAGDLPDQLLSKVEVTPEAQIIVNGQRIQ